MKSDIEIARSIELVKIKQIARDYDIPEEEISEWAMDLAYDMDEFFRQNDPQYAPSTRRTERQRKESSKT